MRVILRNHFCYLNASDILPFTLQAPSTLQRSHVPCRDSSHLISGTTCVNYAQDEYVGLNACIAFAVVWLRVEHRYGIHRARGPACDADRVSASAAVQSSRKDEHFSSARLLARSQESHPCRRPGCARITQPEAMFLGRRIVGRPHFIYFPARQGLGAGGRLGLA